jgi:hypothetical protein
VVEVDTNGNGGSYTYRVDNVVGIGDLLLPVVVPRSQADIVSYHVTPASGNPFVNLKNHDQEAYEELMNITGIDALKQHYEEITVKET